MEARVGDTPCEFYLGEYGGFDRFVYACAKRFRERHSSAKLIFVTPYLPDPEQKEKNEEQKRRFDFILFPPLENVPPRYAISHRNKWIVRQADFIIVFIRRRFGGAYATYQYAKQQGKEIYHLGKAPLN